MKKLLITALVVALLSITWNASLAESSRGIYPLNEPLQGEKLTKCHIGRNTHEKQTELRSIS